MMRNIKGLLYDLCILERSQHMRATASVLCNGPSLTSHYIKQDAGLGRAWSDLAWLFLYSVTWGKNAGFGKEAGFQILA